MDEILKGVSKEFLLMTTVSLFMWGARLEYLANTLKSSIKIVTDRTQSLDSRINEQANISRTLEMNVVQKLG